MALTPRPLVAGNWKMQGLKRASTELAAIMQGASRLSADVSLMICPPATLLAAFSGLARGSKVLIGAQDCHPEPAGAFTGEISAEMLADAGATAVIVGHSERRISRQESDATVRAKAKAAWRAGLTAIVCLGETREQRQARQMLAVLGVQLAGSVPDNATAANLVVAYEPVWAIGTGLTPTPQDVGEVHGFIRERLIERFGDDGAAIRILYGGSVKPGNARGLLGVANVNGALVGGASLKADEFLAIAVAYTGA